jgi:heme-degrading monooxygenase HmoA
MFNRISRLQLVQGDMDERIANYAGSMAPLEGLEGYLGCALLVDRQSNTAISVTYWATSEARQASEAAAAGIRAQAVGDGGRLIEIDRMEQVIAERTAPPGAEVRFARVTDFYGVPDKLDAGIAYARDSVLPVLKQQPGFRAMVVAVNRDTGRLVASSVWDTSEARAASELAIAHLRSAAAPMVGASGARVEHFDAVYANIKVLTPA